MSEPANPPAATIDARLRCARWHLRIGWWSLFFFAALGVTLEALHGFKIGWYLDVENETRRLMLTLGHAHGTLFSLINLAFGGTVYLLPNWRSGARTAASYALLAATPLVPLGFVGGGIWILEGDPGLPILLVPAGAILLLISIGLTACGIESLARSSRDEDAES